MRLFTFISVLAISLSTIHAQQYGYGPSAGPGQVVSMDPGGAVPNYGYNPAPTIGASSGLSSGGRGSSMLSYGLLEGFYKYTTFEQEGIDAAHGVGISLSAELLRPFFVRGSFDWGTGNGSALTENYDFNSVSLGGGGYFAVTDKFHFFAEIGGSYTNLNTSRSSLSFSDGAVYITPGLRFAATESLELNLSVTASSADSYDSKLVDIAGYYKLFSSMDVGLGTGFGDETRNFFAGIRFRW